MHPITQATKIHYTMRPFLFFLLLGSFLHIAKAQKILQIEKYGSPRTEKLFIGDAITYQLKEDDMWYSGQITNLLVDQNIISLDDRYVQLENIDAFRYQRGWAKPVGISLYTFGVAWSGFALIGTATDGDPSTSYRASDAVVSAVSIGLGFVVSKLLATKTIRFGKRRRLRMLDLSFKPPNN